MCFKKLDFFGNFNEIFEMGIEIFTIFEMKFEAKAAAMCGTGLHKQLVKNAYLN
jgi:hypothetical protein